MHPSCQTLGAANTQQLVRGRHSVPHRTARASQAESAIPCRALVACRSKPERTNAIYTPPQARAVRPTAARARAARSRTNQFRKQGNSCAPRSRNSRCSSSGQVKKFSDFGLRSSVTHVHTESMQVAARPTSVFGQKALNSQNGKASSRRPAPNPSIEGTASGLRPTAAPHVKR